MAHAKRVRVGEGEAHQLHTVDASVSGLPEDGKSWRAQFAWDEPPVGMLRWESLRDMTPGPHDSGEIVIVGHTSQKGWEALRPQAHQKYRFPASTLTQ